METKAVLDATRPAHWLRNGNLRLAPALLEQAFLRRSLRRPVLRKIERDMVAWARGKSGRQWPAPERVVEDQVDMLRAMFASAERALDRGQV